MPQSKDTAEKQNSGGKCDCLGTWMTSRNRTSLPEDPEGQCKAINL